MLFVGAIFATLGGLLGAAFFKKTLPPRRRRRRQPPAVDAAASRRILAAMAEHKPLAEIDAICFSEDRIVRAVRRRSARSAHVTRRVASTRAADAIPKAFWAGFAAELEWITPWTQVLDWKPPHAKWFVGGKLNASVNCLDRHVRDRAPQQGRASSGKASPATGAR